MHAPHLLQGLLPRLAAVELHWPVARPGLLLCPHGRAGQEGGSVTQRHTRNSGQLWDSGHDGRHHHSHTPGEWGSEMLWLQ